MLYSNTTNVKVKLIYFFAITFIFINSNTTNVKVKPILVLYFFKAE